MSEVFNWRNESTMQSTGENMIAIPTKVLVGVEELCMVTLREALDKLETGGKLTCTATEALASLDLTFAKGAKKSGVRGTKKPKKEKPAFPMPFCGVVDEASCQGIRLNHGLHTQCVNEKAGLGDYCKTCQKHADKNANGKPAHGDIRERLECGLLEFRDPKGRQTIPYGNVVEKLGLDKEAVLAEAEKFGITIPEEHWNVVKKTRGRPKKATSVSDTDSVKSDDKPKKRGRPKKVKVVESAVGDDLLAQLKAAESASDSGSVASSDSGSDSGSVGTASSSVAKARALKKAERDAKRAKAKAEREAKRAEKASEASELKAMKAEEREQKKTERAAAKEAEKQRKAEERAAAKAAKEAEKEAEKQRKAEERAAAKAAKEAEKEAEKQRKAEERAAAKATKAEKALKEAEKAAEASKTALNKPELEAEVESESEAESDEEEEGETVEKFTHNGKTYLRDGDGTVYTDNIEDPEIVGIWNKETKTIDEVDVMSDDEDEE